MSEVDVEPVPIEHRRLRSAIEFAVAIANAGQRLRPTIPFPVAFKPYLKASRIPGAALGALRRAIETDGDFRRRLAAGAVPELVDEIGQEWLRRDAGWEERIATLIAQQDEEAEAADAAARLRRAEKRRDAAEQVVARSRAELVAVTDQLADARRELAEVRVLLDATASDDASRRGELTAARNAARHAEDRALAAARRVEKLASELEQTRTERDDLAAQRDGLLAERAERAGVSVSATDMSELRRSAEVARRLAGQLGAIVATPEPVVRRPVALTGGITRDSVRASEALLRSGALVLVDGYNVSMLAWPGAVLAEQRSRLLDLADDVARRFGAELAVVFDGADVVGTHGVRRLVRVRYSPAGVTADDVIRDEVAAVPAARPVVVVTNDGAVRRDVAAAGANLIGSAAFVEVARGRRPSKASP